MLGLPEADAYHVVDFWGERYRYITGQRLDEPQLEAHGVFLAAVRPAEAAPQYVGDTLHVSQGLIIHRWLPSETSLRAEVALGRRGGGTVWVALPADPTEASFGGRAVRWRREGNRVYALPLDIDGKGSLEVRWA
jgi:hypothetical protein